LTEKMNANLELSSCGRFPASEDFPHQKFELAWAL
jgi:hypothetical protein